jgi:hypothetical protein
MNEAWSDPYVLVGLAGIGSYLTDCRLSTGYIWGYG